MKQRGLETKQVQAQKSLLDAETEEANHPTQPIPDLNYRLFLKKQVSLDVQNVIASFLVGSQSALIFKKASQTSNISGNFFKMPARAIATEEFTRILHRLTHRIKVDETLAQIQKNPGFLQTLPFPLTTTGRSGHRVTRYSIMGVLDALDEYDVVAPEVKAQPCAMIPTLRALFDKNPVLQAQIDQQLAEASNETHQGWTEKRHKRHLGNIEAFIHTVIQCDEISNESKKTFEDHMVLKIVQDFIETAFQLASDDKGEFGVMIDVWQLCLDYIYLFNQYIDEQDMIPNTIRLDPSCPILGRIWDRKVDVVDAAVYLALHRFAQFCHLEVLAVGVEKVANCILQPVRFDCGSEKISELLKGLGYSHILDFFSGTKESGLDIAALLCCSPRIAQRGAPSLVGRDRDFKTLVTQKQQQKTLLTRRMEHPKSLHGCSVL